MTLATSRGDLSTVIKVVWAEAALEEARDHLIRYRDAQVGPLDPKGLTVMAAIDALRAVLTKGHEQTVEEDQADNQTVEEDGLP